MTTAVLSVRSLRVALTTGSETVFPVEDVSLELKRGQILGLVGESGSGKTMVLRSIVDLLPPRARIVAGSVLLGDEDLVGARRSRLRELRGSKIAMMFQEPMTALNPVVRVGPQIAEGPRRHLGRSRKQAKARALELMKLVGIPDPRRRFHSYPHELSGGMRQRVMIAIALACEPEVILCDEPTTALDVTIQDQILRLLLRLRAEVGVSLILVTHDLAVVAGSCDVVSVMYAGQLVESGPVGQVFAAPRHPYTSGLLAAVPEIHHSRTPPHAIPGAPPELGALPQGCRFHPRCPIGTEECTVAAVRLMPVGRGRQSACIRHSHCPLPAELRRLQQLEHVADRSS